LLPANASTSFIQMAYVKKRENRPSPVKLIGVGLDSDGHERITKGEHFALYGGSRETHEKMTETTIKIGEKLKQRGRTMNEVSREEFDDIAHEVGLRRKAPHLN
jgi:hypothetical protein